MLRTKQAVHAYSVGAASSEAYRHGLDLAITSAGLTCSLAELCPGLFLLLLFLLLFLLQFGAGIESVRSALSTFKPS